MTDCAAVKDESVVRLTQPQLADMGERMTQCRADVMKERARGADELRLAGQTKTIKRKDLEMTRQAVQRRIRRERPSVILVRDEHFRRIVALQRLVQLLLRGILLDAELAGRQVQERQTQPRNGCDIVIDGFVEQPVLGHRARRDNTGDVATDQPLRRLRVLDLIDQRRGLAGADKLGEIGVQRMMGNPAHRLIAAMRQRRSKNRRGNNRIFSEHLVEVAESKHQDGAGRNLALQSEVLPLHRCQFIYHNVYYSKIAQETDGDRPRHFQSDQEGPRFSSDEGQDRPGVSALRGIDGDRGVRRA